MTSEHENVLNEHKVEVAVRRKKNSTFWMLSTFVLLGVIVALFLRGGNPLTGNAVGFTSESKVSEQTEKYINENLLANSPYKAKVEDATTESGLYKLKVQLGPQKLDLYVSKNGNLLFPSAIDMTQKVEAQKAPEQQQPQNVPKTAKPTMDMFVMSQCPFGVQAENSMLEVVKALGDKIEYKIHYIVNDNGDGTFQSLHGPNEADENIRQLCIKAKVPDKFYAYLECVNKDYRNAPTAWEKCAKDSGVDTEQIKSCASDEGKKLLSEDAKIANQKNVGGSPTIEVNGVQYRGTRSPEALKAAMCKAFTQAPSECDKVLSSEESTLTTAAGCGA